jgi:tRNA (cmo5U34)-methyltransferase
MTHSVSQHLRIEIDSYDRTIRHFIGGYDEMLYQAVAAVGQARQLERVIDFGAGTGALSDRLLGRFPDVVVELWDVDDAMLAKAATRLARFGSRAVFVHRSFFEQLPPVSAVMASLSLHHVRLVEEKAALYRAIAAALRPGGVFVNADITIPLDPAAGRASYRRWARHLVESGGMDEARAFRHFEEWSGEDRYFSLEEELGAIAGAGLVASCPWRRDPATVTLGRKA